MSLLLRVRGSAAIFAGVLRGFGVFGMRFCFCGERVCSLSPVLEVALPRVLLNVNKCSGMVFIAILIELCH